MRLVDLNPEWDDRPDRTGVGIWFDCPGKCCANKPSPWPDHSGAEEGKAKKLRLYVPFTNPLDGGPKKRPSPTWARTGDTFESLSLVPSIDGSAIGSGHWHGFITNGAIA